MKIIKAWVYDADAMVPHIERLYMTTELADQDLREEIENTWLTVRYTVVEVIESVGPDGHAAPQEPPMRILPRRTGQPLSFEEWERNPGL